MCCSFRNSRDNRLASALPNVIALFISWGFINPYIFYTIPHAMSNYVYFTKKIQNGGFKPPF